MPFGYNKCNLAPLLQKKISKDWSGVFRWIKWSCLTQDQVLSKYNGTMDYVHLKKNYALTCGWKSIEFNPEIAGVLCGICWINWFCHPWDGSCHVG